MKRKSIVAIILALVLCFAMTACGSGADPVVGTYKVYETSTEGNGGVSGEDYVYFNEDGTWEMVYLGKDFTGTWEKTDEVSSFLDGVDRQEYSIDCTGSTSVMTAHLVIEEDVDAPWGDLVVYVKYGDITNKFLCSRVVTE